MRERTSYEVVCSYLPERLRRVMNSISINDRRGLTEVRLRSGRPVSMVYPYGFRFVTDTGELTASHKNSACLCVSPAEIAAAVEMLCKYSVHSCRRELCEGYFVPACGIRVGAAGTVNTSAGGAMSEFSSLNFRIAREVKGCAEELYRMCGNSSGVLICGRVNSGKTTILRDLCRITGNSEKAVLIDERNEISASSGGSAGFDVGAMTDVIVGQERAAAICTAVRTLSPEVIFCDELAVPADSAAILSAFGSGVRFAATIHAGTYEELMKREVGRSLIEAGVFGYAVFLQGSGGCSEIREIRRLCDAV